MILSLKYVNSMTMKGLVVDNFFQQIKILCLHPG